MPSKRSASASKKAAELKKKNQTYTTVALISFGVLILLIVIFFAFSLREPKPASLVYPTSARATSTQQSSTSVSTQETAPEVTPHLTGTKQYSNMPPMLIDVTKQYFATVTMAKGGEFVIQLFPDKAPLTVNSFVFLSRQGYFDGVTFHRVLDGFMAQGGDPTGTGMGDPGYEFVNEDSDLLFDKAGVVAMANAGRDTNGSQFFITFAPAEHLNGGYTIFGQVIEGMEVVNNITLRNPEQNPAFSGDAIETITIVEK